MHAMEEFWGIKVKNGKCLKVSPGDGRVLHLSQASLGKLKDKNGKENVNLFINVDGKKLVLGTLITNKLPQYQFDVSFDRDFEVSHNWKSGSVYLYGYKASKSSKEELFKGESGKTELKVEKVLDAGQTELKLEKVTDDGRDLVKIAETNKDLNTQEEDETTFEDVMPDDEGKDDSQVEKVLDAGKTELMVEKVLDGGRDLVKIAETNKDLNTQEEDETTFEEVATSKKRSLESVECATATPISENKARRGKKRAKRCDDTRKTELKVEKVLDAGQTELKLEKVTDDGRDLVKIAETNKDLNTQEEDETTFEDVMPDDEGKDDSQVEKVLDAGQTELKLEKVTDDGRDLVKIAETNKDLNTQEEDETTFEDVMSDDEGKDDSQVATSKKRSLESVEGATATPNPENKAKSGPKRAKLCDDTHNENGRVKTHPCKICNKLYVSVAAADAHAKKRHSDIALLS